MLTQTKQLSSIQAATLFIEGNTKELNDYCFQTGQNSTDLIEEGFYALLRKRKHTINPDQLGNTLETLKEQYKNKCNQLLSNFNPEAIEKLSNQYNRISKVGYQYYKKLTGQLF
jgi:hypothetical protein